jgi:hypothetical protein
MHAVPLRLGVVPAVQLVHDDAPACAEMELELTLEHSLQGCDWSNLEA